MAAVTHPTYSRRTGMPTTMVEGMRPPPGGSAGRVSPRRGLAVAAASALPSTSRAPITAVPAFTPPVADDRAPGPAARTPATPDPEATPSSTWEADLDRGLAKAIAICAVIGVTAFTLDPVFSERYDAALVAIHAAFALAAAGCVADVLAEPPTRRGVRVFAGLGVALCAAMPFMCPPDVASTGYPPYIHVITVSVLAVPYAVSPGAGVLASLVLAAAVFHERTATVGAAQGQWEALSYLGAGLVGVTVFVLLRDRAGEVAQEARHTRLAEEADAREAAAARERDRWDSLVHDSVLGALPTAARSPRWSTERAGQDLATEALRALDAPADERRLPFVPAVRRRAEALGLVIGLREDTREPAPPDEVAEALTDATIEALTNVARHAGTDRATVTVQDHPAGRRVVVQDEGRGFDPDADSDERAGVRLNIRARMQSVGGTASIRSTPGAGTRVVLEVPRTTPQPDRTPPQAWTTRMFRPALACAALCVIAHAAIGVLWISETVLPWVTLAGLIATLIAMTMASIGSWAERCLVVWVVVGLGVPTVLALNLVDPLAPDWRWWFVGYQNVLVATLAFRGNVRAAFAIALGLPLTMGLAVYLAHGTVPFAALLEACPQVLVWAVVGIALRRALDSAAATIEASERARSELRLARSLREVRETQRAERRMELGWNVLPMLRRLGRPVDLTDEQRRTCRFLESSARDQLVARCLVTPEVACAVSSSRRLGASVELVALVDDSGPAAAAFRELLTALLSLLGRDERLRATWRHRDGAPVGTIVIVGDGSAVSRVEPTVQQVRRRLPRFAVDTSYDDSAGLIVLQPL